MYHRLLVFAMEVAMSGLLTYIKKAWKRLLSQKGQGLTEFALVLAFCAGIGWAANSVGFREAINAVIDSGRQNEQHTAAIGGDNVNKYAALFHEMRVTRKTELINSYSAKQRVDADLSGLQNIANALIGMDEATFRGLINSVPYDGKEGYQILAYRDKEGYYREQQNSDKFHSGAIKDGAKDTGTETNLNMATLLLGNSTTESFVKEFGKDNDGSWRAERYFFSDGMVNDGNGRGGGDVQSRVYAQIETNTDGKITGVHIYVRSNGGVKYFIDHDQNGKQYENKSEKIIASEQNKVLQRTGSDGTSNLYEGVYAGTVSEATMAKWQKGVKK